MKWVTVYLTVGLSCSSLWGQQEKLGAAASANQPALGQLTRGYLGVVTKPVLDEVRAHISLLPSEIGVMICTVQTGSPAEKAGLRSHDILVSMSGTQIKSPEQFIDLLRQSKPGTHCEFDLIRGGKSLKCAATLTDARNQAGVKLSLKCAAGGTVELQEEAGKWQANVIDNLGHSIFSGPATTTKEREAIPAAWREHVEKLIEMVNER